MIKTIAIGNRLMKDDGIAIAVLESIRSKLEPMGIEVIIGETDFQFCYHLLQDDDFIVLLDAAYSGERPGSVHLSTLQEVLASYGKTSAQHDMSVFDLMRLYAKPFKGYLIHIEAAEVELGWEISETLKKKFHRICERMIQNISQEVNMHDTFLNERIYEEVLKLCRENKIVKLTKVILSVNSDSHISENSLREQFSERNNHLLGDWTEIYIEKKDVGKLNAVIQRIEGDSSDE